MNRKRGDGPARNDEVVKFWVDAFGFVWVGPCSGGEGFRYLRFEGVATDLDGTPCKDGKGVWCWQVYDRGKDWEEMPVERFQRFLRLHGCTDYQPQPRQA